MAAGLIALIVVYLALASTVPKLLASALGVRPSGLYRGWPLVTLGIALCVSMLVASWTRIKLDLAHAGAWCSHLGVLILAGGAAWYATASQSGQAVTARLADGWTPIGSFYADQTWAIYVRTAPGGESQQTKIAAPTAGGDGFRPSQLRGLPEGVTASAINFSPRAMLLPATELEIQDGQRHHRVLLQPGPGGHQQFDGNDYLIMYHPQTTPDSLQRIAEPTSPAGGPGLKNDLALVVTGWQIDPTMVVIRPNGSRWLSKLVVGQTMAVRLGGREVRVKPVHFCLLAHKPGEKDESGLAGPAVRVRLNVDGQTYSTWVPFATYEHLASPQRVDLPGRRRLYLNFSRIRRPLGARIFVEQTEYLTYPGSVVPKDYRCEVRLDETKTVQVVSLNHPLQVGAYQLSQGSWMPSGEVPQEIVFIVTSRPGLRAIWLGCILIAAGFPYAFYVKPLILRRRARR